MNKVTWAQCLHINQNVYGNIWTSHICNVTKKHTIIPCAEIIKWIIAVISRANYEWDNTFELELGAPQHSFLQGDVCIKDNNSQFRE